MVGPHRLPCETPEAHQPDESVRGPTRWVLPATILGSSLGFIDSSVVNVALPAIQQSLGTGLATAQWVVNGYMLTLAGLILLGGSAADRFGRRRIFLSGLVGFGMASLACAIAPTAPWLIAARLVQGAAAALVMPASLAIIGASYTGEARGPAIGTWAAAGALTTALGPPLGGWMVDTIGWRAVFFINIPVVVAALLLGFRLAADPDTDRAPPLDALGALLAMVALGSLSYGLIALGQGARTPGLIALAAAIPAAAVFIRRERRATAPMMPLQLFRDATFSGANALTLLLYAALGGALFLLPFMLIKVHGYRAMAAGAAFLPFSAIMGFGSRWSGRLVERLGSRLPLMLGPSITAIGFAVLAFSSGLPSYWSGFLPGLTLVAIGMTLSVAPLTTTVFDAAPSGMSGTASGINNAAARTGGLIAVAALGLAFGNASADDVDAAALAQGYRWVMLTAAVLALLSAIIAMRTIRSRTQPETAVPATRHRGGQLR